VAASHGANAIIVVEGDGGQINLTGQPVQLADGQALLGGQSIVRLTDAKDSDISANFHAPGQRPTIVGSTSTANLIQMYSGGQNRVTGLNLEGTFANAIFGSNMERAIVTDNFIDPPASNGIFLQNAGSGVPTSQFLYIARNTVDGAGSAGIAMRNYLSDGLAHTQTVVIVDNSITNAGIYGIEHTVSDLSLASFTQSVLIAGNSISGAGNGGIVDSASFISMPGTVTERLAIYGNDITGARTGIQLGRVAVDLAGISQDIAITGNSLGVVSSTGIGFGQTLVSISGAAIANLAVSYNTIASAGGGGIAVGLNGTNLGSLSQTIAVDGNSLGTVASNGIEIGHSLVFVTGAVVANLSISDNSLTSAGGDGIDLGINATSDGSISQTVAIDRNSLGTIASSGIALGESLLFVSGMVATDLSVSDNNLASAGGNEGIAVGLSGVSLGGLSQTVVVDGNSMGRVASDGLVVNSADFSVSGPVTSGISASYNTVTSAAAGRGIVVGLDTGGLSAGLSQAVAVDHNAVGTVASDGIALVDTVSGVGGAVTSGVSVSYNSIASAGGNGINATVNFTSLGSLSETVVIDHNTAGRVGIDGIFLNNNLGVVSGGVTSGVSVSYNSLTSAGADGIDITLNDVSLGGLAQTVAVDHNHAGTVGGNGIVLGGNLFSDGGTVLSDLSVGYNAVTSAARNGIELNLNGSNLAGLSQSVTADHNSIGTVGTDGIFLNNNIFAVSGAVSSSLSFSYNSLTSAGRNGIVLDLNGSSLAGLSQSVAADHNSIGTVGSDGLFLNNNVFAVSGAVSSGLSFSYNSLTSAGATGIELNVNGTSLAGLSQSVAADHNSIGTVGSDGIFLNGNIFAVSGAVTSGLSFSYNSLTSAGARGIELNLNGTSLAGLSQSIAANHNNIGRDGSDGIFLNNNIVAVGGSVTSGLSFSYNSLTSAGGNGIFVIQTANTATVVQTLAIDGNGISAAASNGIASALVAGAAGTVSQGGTVNANTVRSAGNGVLISAGAVGAGTAGVNLSLSGNILSQNAGNGFAGQANGAGASETITLVSGSGNHFTSNGGAGVFLSNLGGSLTFHINGNDLSGNTGGTTATAGAVTITP
jgi:hypothetical protein